MVLGFQNKQDKYRFVALITIFFSGYVLMFRFIFLGLELKWYDLFLFGTPLVLLFLFSIYLPLKGHDTHQTLANKYKWYDSVIVNPESEPDIAYLPFKKPIKLDIDWSDTESLKEKLEGEMYQSFYRLYIKTQIDKETKKKKISRSDALKLWTIMDKKIEGDLDKNPDKLYDPSFEKELDDITKQFDLSTKDIVPTEQFKVEQIEKDLPLKKEDGVFENLNLFFQPLGQEQSWKDPYGEDHTFDKIFVLINGEQKELLETRTGWGWWNGWRVNTNECITVWTYWFLVNERYPLFYLTFTENEAKNLATKLYEANSKTQTYIQFKVLETWNNFLEIRPERLKKENLKYKQKSKIMENSYFNMLQEDAETKEKFGYFHETEMVQEEKLKTESYKKKYQIALILMTIGFIVAGIFIGLYINLHIVTKPLKPLGDLLAFLWN